MRCFADVEKKGLIMNVLNEIVLQSKVEFNYNEEDEDDTNNEPSLFD
jgi:hypothetical protein